MSIDWQAVWDELNWQDDDSLLRQRARQYAATLPEQDDNQEKQSVLAFRVGGEQYAVDVYYISTVRPAPKITPVPGTPAFYPGVVNVRGQIITVLDLLALFGLLEQADDVPGELIVIAGGGLRFALLVNRVLDVFDLPDADLEPLDDVRYVRGITQDRLMLLDIPRLLEDDRLIIGGLDE